MSNLKIRLNDSHESPGLISFLLKLNFDAMSM